MKKIYFILVVLIGLNTYVFAQCNNPDDYAALYALYNSTDGPNWNNNTNWDVSTIPPATPPGLDMSTWHGLTCSGGRVTEVHLQSNILKGSIPSQLENLTNLQQLFLEHNQLSGSIPDELGNLTNLQQLFLEFNQLSGSIPPSLGDLGNLQDLYLSFNQLTGSIPSELGTLNNLEYLILFSNQLTGSIPSELGNLSSVQTIRLGGNGLTGCIPSVLENLGNLRNLELSSNQLTGSIPSELGNLGNLEYLYLADNQLIGSIPPELGNLGLKLLHIYGNQLTGSIPPELGNLNSLLTLQLYNNQLTGNIPSELGNLGNLKSIFLRNNQLTGNIPSELGNLGNLERILLDNNQLTGSIPVSFNQLSQLFQFSVNNNQLSGCYDSALKDGASVLCNFSNADISAGNTFDALWESFCNSNAGSCCQTNIWTGSVDTNWEVIGNWSKGHTPMDCENIIISGLGTTVNVNSANAKAASVSIVNGNTLNVNAGATLTINGDLNALSTDGINISGNNSIVNNAGTIICSNIKRRGLNINFGGVFNNSDALQISGYNQHIQAYHGIEVYEMGQMTNTGSITINSSVSNFDTDGISCKSGASITNSGSITIANIQGANSEGITNEATFSNEATGTITINTVGSSYGLLNTATFNNNGSISTSNTFMNGIQNIGGAIFSGNGNASMNMFENAATLSPGNSPGAITLNGNFNTSSSYYVEINNKNGIGVGHDHLQVNGDVSFDGDILVDNNTLNGTLLDDDKFVVLSYTGTRTGTFSTEKLNSFPPGWAVAYDPPFCGKCVVVHGATAVLPVKLTNFDARKIENKVALQWTTASEINNKGFEVQHSTDGKNWQNLVWVEGNGTSTLNNSYQYIHQKPENGHNYYRLQQFDFDEKFEYSKVISMDFEGEINITLYPNPTKDVLFISSSENLNEAVLSIVNSVGQKMNTIFLRKGEKEVSLDVSNLSNGLYIVNILLENGQSIVKQVCIMEN